MNSIFLYFRMSFRVFRAFRVQKLLFVFGFLPRNLRAFRVQMYFLTFSSPEAP